MGKIGPAATILLMGVTEDLENFRLRRSHLLVNSTAAVATVIRNGSFVAARDFLREYYRTSTEIIRMMRCGTCASDNRRNEYAEIQQSNLTIITTMEHCFDTSSTSEIVRYVITKLVPLEVGQ